VFGMDLYVEEVLTKAERERRDASHGNLRWLIELEMSRPPRRTLTTWLGDHLVALGERLRGWPATEQRSVRTRRAL
jgi:hypothetical protein